MKSLESEWDEFASACGLDAPDVGAVQRSEMRRAFLAGAYVVGVQAREGGPRRVEALRAEAERGLVGLMTPGVRAMAQSVIAAIRRRGPGPGGGGA